MVDVFVSYAHKDHQAVEPLVRALEARGWSVWWDREIEPGVDFRRRINMELEEAKCVLVVWSQNAVDSDWVIGEAMRGLDRGVLVPVTIDDVRVPLPFNAVHTPHLPPVGHPEFDRFAAHIRGRLGGETQVAPITTHRPSRAKGVIGSRPLPTCLVLPFDSFDPGSDGALFGEGIAADVISALSNFASVDVVSRRTAFSPRIRDLDLQAIGSALGAEYVVSGSVAHSKETLRVGVELADTMDGIVIWSRHYDRSVEDVGELRLELAEQIVREIGAEFVKLPVAGLRGAANWILFHKARNAFFAYDAEALRKCLALLQEALENDADDVMVLSFEGAVRAELAFNGFEVDEEAAYDAALVAVERARRLGPDNALPLKYAGVVYAYVGRHEESLAALQRATQLNPYDLGSWGYMGWSLSGSSDDEDLFEVSDLLNRIVSQAPNHSGMPFWRLHQATVATVMEDFAQAALKAADAVQLAPGLALARWIEANAHAMLGDHELARSQIETAKEHTPTMDVERYAQLSARLSRDDLAYERRVAGLEALGMLENSGSGAADGG